MSFEIIQPGKFVATQALPEGSCSIDRSGALTAHASDLRMVGVVERAVVLADRASLRLAVRAPRDGEDEMAVAVGRVNRGGGAANTDSGRRHIRVKRALDALGLTGEATAGRFELNIKGEGVDGLLIVNLIATPEQVSGEPRGGAR